MAGAPCRVSVCCLQTALRRSESQYVAHRPSEFRYLDGTLWLLRHYRIGCWFPSKRDPFGSDVSIKTILAIVTWVIVGSFVGFIVLAFILLFPIYRFLKKEAQRNRDQER